MNDVDAQYFAEKIAEDLFVNGFKERASRLVMKCDESNRDLGGWCRVAVEDRIRERLILLDLETPAIQRRTKPKPIHTIESARAEGLLSRAGKTNGMKKQTRK